MVRTEIDVDSKILNFDLEEMPAVVCTAGSYILKRNSFVEDLRGKFEEGRALFDSMEPRDVLRFDACFAAWKSAEVFTFPLSASGRYTKGCAMFSTVLGHRLAVVLLEGAGNSGLLQRALKMSPRERESFCCSNIKSILSVPDHLPLAGERDSVMDIKTAARRVLSNFSNMKRAADFTFTITENAEMERTAYMPCEMPLRAFVQAAVQMLFIATAVSAERSAELRLCKYNMQAELRVITELESGLSVSSAEALSRLYPEIAANISVCTYAAGLFNSSFTVCCHRDEKKLSLVLSIGAGEYGDVDFKSRDCFAELLRDFDFAYRYTSLL